MISEQKAGRPAGICSICSSHPIVIEAAMEHYKAIGRPLLIESTSNQVNQYGGYTGLKPRDFSDYIEGIARKTGFDTDMVILGGDHLGPFAWCGENAESCMEKSEALVRAYVQAGYEKIHIDTSMRLGDDDPDAKLGTGAIAERAARLCRVAEEAWDGQNSKPVYVIGSEVPVPGGAQENEDALQVTPVEDAKETLREFEDSFSRYGLQDAWERVAALVVQPGVEYADNTIIPYDRGKAADLCAYIRHTRFILEGHSTDYQTREALHRMMEDGIAILKVGPALTFAMREGLFALEMMERELCTGTEPSRFSAILEAEMLQDTRHWQKYYQGTPDEQCTMRKYSLSDRCRYYLSTRAIEDAVQRLIQNMRQVQAPLGMLSQYMPEQFKKVAAGTLAPGPYEWVKDKVRDVLRDYD